MISETEHIHKLIGMMPPTVLRDMILVLDESLDNRVTWNDVKEYRDLCHMSLMAIVGEDEAGKFLGYEE